MFYISLNPVSLVKLAFRWFIIITIGLILRSDKLGVTSIIRDLALSPGCYDFMLHFFVLLPGHWITYANVGFLPSARHSLIQRRKLPYFCR